MLQCAAQAHPIQLRLRKPGTLAADGLMLSLHEDFLSQRELSHIAILLYVCLSQYRRGDEGPVSIQTFLKYHPTCFETYS